MANSNQSPKAGKRSGLGALLWAVLLVIAEIWGGRFVNDMPDDTYQNLTYMGLALIPSVVAAIMVCFFGYKWASATFPANRKGDRVPIASPIIVRAHDDEGWDDSSPIATQIRRHGKSGLFLIMPRFYAKQAHSLIEQTSCAVISKDTSEPTGCPSSEFEIYGYREQLDRAIKTVSAVKIPIHIEYSDFDIGLIPNE